MFLSLLQYKGELALGLCAIILILILILILARVTLHLRIANQVEEDSCCRGGIVHIRGGCSCALLERPESPKALWRFRVSTSNSPSGRSLLQTNTHFRYIYQTFAQQDIRVCGDDHFQPHKRQYDKSKAL
jgi:hypothetical protein